MRRLLIRPGAIGDFIVSLPALECLRQDYTELWAASANVPLARFADRARSIASTGLDLLGITEPDPKLVRELAGFDSVVSWYGSNRPEFRETVEALGLRFRFLTALPPEGCGEHAADYYLAQAGCPAGGVPRIACPGRRGDYAVIHPFAGSLRKRWPLERFQELARRLQRHLPVHWCAGPEDSLPGAVRFDNLYDLACWLAGARVYIGHDSGISHLAAAAGAPSVALFGPTDPGVWAPRGPRVRIVQAGTPGTPLDVLSVETVASVVYHLLGESF